MRVDSYVAQKSDYDNASEFRKAKEDERTISELLGKYNLSSNTDIKKLYTLVKTGKVMLYSPLGDRFYEDVIHLYEGGDRAETNSTRKVRASKSENTPTDSAVKKPVNPKTKDRASFDDLDAGMQESVANILKKKHKRRKFLLILLSLAAIVFIGYFFWYYKHASSSESRWEELSDLVGSEALLIPENTEEEPLVIHYEDMDVVVPPVLTKYQTLYNKNKSLIGWIKIADTIIDYPVMQCGDNDYYLKHNFDQKEDAVGCIFMDYACDVLRGCDNYILYGHHLQSGKMFSSLEKYENEKYYEQHPYINFDTIYEEHTYQVMYVFRSRVYEVNDVNFKYYQFIKANSEQEFASAMEEMKALSFYDTGVTASYGDQLLTLSTCDYEQMNGRFVVVCKEID